MSSRSGTAAKARPSERVKEGAKEQRIKPQRQAAVSASDPAGAEDLSSAATRLASAIEQALADGRPESLSIDALQKLTAALCKTYGAQVDAGSGELPLAGRTSVSSTDVMVTASGLLRAANLAVFELGMWQSWTGR